EVDRATEVGGVLVWRAERHRPGSSGTGGRDGNDETGPGAREVPSDGADIDRDGVIVVGEIGARGVALDPDRVDPDRGGGRRVERGPRDRRRRGGGRRAGTP